jgi:CO/xanthine dehydrogenase Mo-binding subunit
MTDNAYIGKKMSGVYAPRQVTGEGRYCADISMPGMLIGKLLYSPYSSARISHLDVSKVEKLESVIVMTHRDVPGKNSFLYADYLPPDQPLFAVDRIRYQGDIVAAVAAPDESLAETALGLIEVEYEPLSPVTDPVKAMKNDSLRVWDEKGNILHEMVSETGDIDQAFLEAEFVYENTYFTPFSEHAFLETESALAFVDNDGLMVVYASCQAPHRDRRQIARALGVFENQVRVITPLIGGAFGGKDEAHVQIHAALLANLSRKAVSIVRSREESIRVHLKRHPAIMRRRSGVNKEGRIIAAECDIILDTGPYVNAGYEVMDLMTKYGVGAYDIPNVRIHTHLVATNNPICGAFRGFGLPQVTFASEVHMDELAEKASIDPLDFRLRNGLKNGTRLYNGTISVDGEGIKACLEKAAEISRWREKEDEKGSCDKLARTGWGIAQSLQQYSYGAGYTDFAGASLEMAVDGSVILRSGAADMGQGVHTVLIQLAAEYLGVKMDVIRILPPDTSRAPDAGPSVASRQTVISGNAVINAAEKIRNVLLNIANEETGIPSDLLKLKCGYLYAENERLPISVQELAEKAIERNLSLHAHGYYAMQHPDIIAGNGQTGPILPAGYGAQIAKVTVDPETGVVNVDELIAVHDVGTLVNPDGAAGQVYGGCAMGVGYALMEQLQIVDGRTINNSFASYLIPTSSDIPEMKIAFIESKGVHTRHGAKGLGELPTAATAPAIANAIADAIGVHMCRLPMTPERVWDAYNRPVSGEGASGIEAGSVCK